MDVGLGVVLTTGGFVTTGPGIDGVGSGKPVSCVSIVLSGLLLLYGVVTIGSSVGSSVCAACVGSGVE